jgi:hypothetical protein
LALILFFAFGKTNSQVSMGLILTKIFLEFLFFICRSVVSENEMAVDAFFCVATSLPDVCCVCGG